MGDVLALLRKQPSNFFVSRYKLLAKKGHRLWGSNPRLRGHIRFVKATRSTTELSRFLPCCTTLTAFEESSNSDSDTGS